MIAAIRGEVLHIALDHAVIDAAGLGYHVNVTPATLATLTRGKDATLLTHLIVREDSMTLYGFADAQTRDLFVLLLTVSGIGPRIAMAMLAVYAPDVLCAAIGDGDHAALTRVPGIGKRGAERIVVELRDKVAAHVGESTVTVASVSTPVRDHVVEALIGLGFAAKQAEQATDSVLAADPAVTTSVALRAALSGLGKSR